MKAIKGCFDYVLRILIPMLATLFLGLATVQDVRAEQMHPCVEDIEKFCKDVKPCEGHIVGCLKDHEGDLSAECRRKVEELNKKIEDLRGHCAGDIENFCKGIKPGGGRVAKCLREHNKELSEQCRERCEIVKEKIKEEKE